MKFNLNTIFLVFILFLSSCKEGKQKNQIEKKTKSNRIVLISINAPEKYIHIIKQDSLGKILKDSLGPRAYSKKNGFTYLDYMNNVKTWQPKPNIQDTLTIECYSEYLELSTNNFFTSINESFLVKNGDTVVFRYKHKIPKAEVKNRKVNDIELNYNSYRLRNLFDNKYTSHYLVIGNLFLSEDVKGFDQRMIHYYMQAKNDYLKEIKLLDSLHNSNTISKTNYQYRKDALNMLMEKHKNLKSIKKWTKQNRTLKKEEAIEQSYRFNLSKTDSLMKFSSFRFYLNHISKYDLNFINENNGNSGSYYIDSRIRFDSILKDKRFNQTAKNFLLFNTYHGIGQNFRVNDKEKYFKKLQENTTNVEKLKELQKGYKLDFSKSDKLVLTSIKNDTITLSNLLKNNKGKWLYVDFWASWCAPCRKTMPASRKLKKELENDNLTFIYLALNDKKENWKKAIIKDSIQDAQHYFIENGNTSIVIEDLFIKTIPHYIIYNPEGKIVNGNAKRPGEGARRQIKNFIDQHKK
ncbi:MAG: TlpA family protein disulfide reductase [Flavobacteriaceae bacterium]